MSVIGKSVKDNTPATAAQPVYLLDMDTGLKGSVSVSGGNGTGPATTNNPLPVFEAQGNIVNGPLALTAATAATAIGAFADRRGMRILNYIEAPVYLNYGTTGTPPSGAGSDYVPAAAAGKPGVWDAPFAPVGGVRVVCASAGSITVTVW